MIRGALAVVERPCAKRSGPKRYTANASSSAKPMIIGVVFSALNVFGRNLLIAQYTSMVATRKIPVISNEKFDSILDPAFERVLRGKSSHLLSSIEHKLRP